MAKPIVEFPGRPGQGGLRVYADKTGHIDQGKQDVSEFEGDGSRGARAAAWRIFFHEMSVSRLESLHFFLGFFLHAFQVVPVEADPAALSEIR